MGILDDLEQNAAIVHPHKQLLLARHLREMEVEDRGEVVEALARRDPDGSNSFSDRLIADILTARGWPISAGAVRKYRREMARR